MERNQNQRIACTDQEAANILAEIHWDVRSFWATLKVFEQHPLLDRTSKVLDEAVSQLWEMLCSLDEDVFIEADEELKKAIARRVESF